MPPQPSQAATNKDSPYSRALTSQRDRALPLNNPQTIHQNVNNCHSERSDESLIFYRTNMVCI